jgi:hypothetical protein
VYALTVPESITREHSGSEHNVVVVVVDVDVDVVELVVVLVDVDVVVVVGVEHPDKQSPSGSIKRPNVGVILIAHLCLISPAANDNESGAPEILIKSTSIRVFLNVFLSLKQILSGAAVVVEVVVVGAGSLQTPLFSNKTLPDTVITG